MGEVCKTCLGEGVGYFFLWDDRAGCHRWVWATCRLCHGTGRTPEPARTRGTE